MLRIKYDFLKIKQNIVILFSCNKSLLKISKCIILHSNINTKSSGNQSLNNIEKIILEIFKRKFRQPHQTIEKNTQMSKINKLFGHG